MREPNEPLIMTASPPAPAAALDRSRILRIAAAARRGKRLPQRRHQRPGTEHQVDVVLADRAGELAMEIRAGGPELEHVAEHRDAPPARADRRLAEQREGGAHRQ